MTTLLSCVEVFLTDGLMYSLLALGYFISFSTLDFPDLSVEGTVVIGAVVYTLLICGCNSILAMILAVVLALLAAFAVIMLLSMRGLNKAVSAVIGLAAGAASGFGLYKLLSIGRCNPWIAIVIAFIFGALAGSVTGFLHVRLKIRPLLCGILVSTALISINLVLTVVGNGGSFSADGALSTISIARKDPTVLKVFPASLIKFRVPGFKNINALIIFFIVAVVFKLILDGYLKTKNGLLLRATGNNTQFVSMLAQDPGKSKIIGLAISNGYAAVAGALIATSRGNANQGMGIGMVVIGLASVIIGLSVFGKLRFMKPTTMVILGSIIYQACLVIATTLGVPSAYNKLIMAVLFTVALVASGKLKKGESKA